MICAVAGLYKSKYSLPWGGDKFAVNEELFKLLHRDLRVDEQSVAQLYRSDNPRYAAKVVSKIRIIYASFGTD